LPIGKRMGRLLGMLGEPLLERASSLERKVLCK
jgi:hypothetical protein